MSARPLEAVIVGAGHRSVLYASYAEKAPEDLRIVGVVDPWDERRGPPDACSPWRCG